MDAALTNELSTLREMVSALQTALAAAKSLTETLQTENKLLRQKLDVLARRIFGVSS